MPPKKEGAGISAFERKRLENMAANKAILTDIADTAKKVIPERPKAPPKRVKREPAEPRTRARSQPSRVLPTRQSSRLAGLEADNETLKRKLEVEAEAQAEKDKQKRLRKADDLSIEDIVVDGKKYGASVDGLNTIFRMAQPGIRTFDEDELPETTDKGLKELRKRMAGLELYDQWQPNDIKIVPQRAYSMAFHPTEDKPIVFAGDKEGALGIFDASQEAPEVDEDDEDTKPSAPAISAFKVHTRTIAAINFSLADAKTVYTASYDSSIRSMDLEKGVSTQVFAPDDIGEDLPISALDISQANPHLLYYSTLHGGVGRHDTRDPAKGELWTLSDHKIGGFSLHPSQPHLLATASLDRHMKIWDLRKMKGSADMRHPSLLGEHESRLSVSHASWSSGGHLATSSYDDTIKIYAFPDASAWKPGHDLSAEAMEPSVKIPHNNQTGRWVTILKPQWQRRPRDGIHKFVIGNMNRFVDVYAEDGSQLAQLDGEGITAVPAVAKFHPTMEWVAGANGSGKLCFWR